MNQKYYIKIKEEHTPSCMCKLLVNWSPMDIANGNLESGYIVQHFSRVLFTKFEINIPQNTSYYEAWRVVEGEVIGRDNYCDDEFSIGNILEGFDLFQKCVGTSGRYVFSGDVFWIPEKHELFSIVDSWIPTVKEAGVLKSVYECVELDSIPPLFSRDPFVHEWNLEDEKVVYSTAKGLFARHYRKGDSHDDLVSTANRLLPDRFENMKRQIIEEWENKK